MNRNLLILCTYYPHQKNNVSGLFVKRQVDELKFFFDKIYVLAVNPRIPFPFNLLKKVPKGTRDINQAKDYSYDNVEVFFIKSYPFSYYNTYASRLFKKVKKLINKKNIDFSIIHSHFTWPAGYIGCQLKKIYHVPTILTVHENKDWLLKEISLKKERLIETWNQSDKIIRVNKIDLEEFEKLGIQKEKLFSIPNGYPSELFKRKEKMVSREKLGLPINKKILLNIGNLEPYKGHEYLVSAMKEINNINQDIILYIIGMGSLLPKIKSQIRKLNLENNVILAGGNKPSSEIPFWINACDLFVLSSLSEGNPTVMFEALGCGKPIIATNVGGIPEIINNKVGLLVEPKNHLKLAETILEGLKIKWDEKIILDYAKEFSWKQIAQKIYSLYNE